jgi:hypothetical protein
MDGIARAHAPPHLSLPSSARLCLPRALMMPLATTMGTAMAAPQMGCMLEPAEQRSCDLVAGTLCSAVKSAWGIGA